MDGKTYWYADKDNAIITDGKRSWSEEVPLLREELSRRMSMIENLENEVEELEAWKAHRLNEADPKVEALVVQLGKKVDALEAWKEKARPFLGEYLLMLAYSLTYETSEHLPDNSRLLQEQHSTLTELLKEPRNEND